MTVSAEPRTRPVPEDLPPALSSMWRLCKLGYRHEPRLLVAAFLLSLAAALPDALLALWLALLGKGVVDGDRRLLLVAATGLGLSAALTWILRTVDARVQRRFRDRVTIALEAHVARLQASVQTVAALPVIDAPRADPTARFALPQLAPGRGVDRGNLPLPR